MLYIVWFTDNPERAAVRERDMPAHLAFLERNADRIRAAGPLRDAADGAPAGGMWLVEAADHADVVSLYQEDPSGRRACANRLRSMPGGRSSPTAGGCRRRSDGRGAHSTKRRQSRANCRNLDRRSSFD
jgi:uncharacterized protein